MATDTQLLLVAALITAPLLLICLIRMVYLEEFNIREETRDRIAAFLIVLILIDLCAIVTVPFI